MGRIAIRKPSNIIGSLLVSIFSTLAILAEYWEPFSGLLPSWGFVVFVAIAIGFFIALVAKLTMEIRRMGIDDFIETPEELYKKKYGEDKIVRNPFVQQLAQKLENLGARIIKTSYGILPKITFSFPYDHHFDSYQRVKFTIEEDNRIIVNAELKYKLPFYFSIRKKIEKDESSKKAIRKKLFTQTYSISSDNHKFTNQILEETLIDEVLSEYESHIDQIAVHGKTLTASFSSLESVELFFILLSTILNTYTR